MQRRTGVDDRERIARRGAGSVCAPGRLHGTLCRCSSERSGEKNLDSSAGNRIRIYHLPVFGNTLATGSERNPSRKCRLVIQIGADPYQIGLDIRLGQKISTYAVRC